MKRALSLLIPITMTWVLLAACVAPMTPVGTQAPATQTCGPAPVTLTVSAASSLTVAFTEIGKLFEAQTGDTVLFNFGALGSLAQQIEQGAPVDLFGASQCRLCRRAWKEGTGAPGYRTELRVRPDRAVDTLRQPGEARADRGPGTAGDREGGDRQPGLRPLRPRRAGKRSRRPGSGRRYSRSSSLPRPYSRHISMPRPATSMRPSESVIERAHRGGRQARSLVVVPQELYTPLDQALAVIKGTKNEAAARGIAAFITGPQGREVLQKYGFTVPGGGE